jgi:hypothetical protein
MPARLLFAIGDQLTKALISGSFDQYRALMDLPLRIVPQGATGYVLHTDAELQADFQLYHAVIKAQGVTDIYRQFRRQETLSDGAISITFTTHVLVKAHRIFDPFETTMRLIERPGGWRISHIESVEDHIKWTLGHRSRPLTAQVLDLSLLQGSDDDAET